MFTWLFKIWSCVFITLIHAQQIPSATIISMLDCNEYPKLQQLVTYPENGSVALRFKSYVGNCIDCDWCHINAKPYVYNCDETNLNQQYTLIQVNGNTSTQIKNTNQGTCMQILNDIYNSSIDMQKCNQSNPLQLFKIDSNGYIRSSKNNSLCITADYFNTNNCNMPPFNTYPYCDQTLPTDQRVNDLVNRMTLTEKVQNLQNRNPGIPRLGVPINSFHEALHGVVTSCGLKNSTGDNTGCPTSFPHALLLGATFNRTLWRQIGAAISTEARSLANQNVAGLFYWAPDINLFRDPRWGRGQEVPGEDPFLTSQYVMEYSYYMENGEDSKYTKVVSTGKHYADYDQEGTYGIGRTSFNANVSMQDQVDYYWPQWRAAIQSGRVKSIMCSYNAINNIPACGNDYFMNQIARHEWGFDGFFVSDCSAIGDAAFENYVNNLYPNDNQTIKQYQTARIAIEGGCDVNCGSWYADYLQQSVENGYVTESDIDRSVTRLFKQSIELGKLDFNPPSYYTNIEAYGPDQVDSNYHRNIALNAAEQGIVLLKNDNNFLPLSMDVNGKSIALVGPHANATQDMLSNYHGTNLLVNSNSPYDAFKSYGKYEIKYDQACNNVSCTNTDFTNAVNIAKNSDYAIVFLGLHPSGHCVKTDNACEAEGRDRNTIEFPGNQLSLLQQIFAVQSNTILVVINGGQLDVTWAKNNIPVIIEAFYPGELGGSAVRNIIYGLANPSGKLPYTIYDKSFLTSRPTIMDMSLRNNGGITYRYYTGNPLYSFGYGLYYTNFTYKNYTNLDKTIDSMSLIQPYRNGKYFYKATSFVIQVTNIGNRGSDCIVLGFISSDNDPDAPLIKLFDFQRVYVDVKQSVNVTLSISPESISVTNKIGNERIVPGKYHIKLGDYQNDNFIHSQLNIIGKEQSMFNLQKFYKRHSINKQN